MYKTKVLKENSTKYWKSHPDVIIHGAVSISNKGIASGFDSSNYLEQYINLDTSTASEWEVYFDIEVTDQKAYQKFVVVDLWGTGNLLNIGTRPNGSNWCLHLWLYNPSGSIIKDTDLRPNYIQAGERIKGKFSYNNGTYTYSEDKDYSGEYIAVSSFTGGIGRSATRIYVGYPSENLRGTANLNNYKLTVNGRTIWEGMGERTPVDNPEMTYWKYTNIANGYRLLDSIKGNGTQTLDTGIYPKDTTKVQSKFIYSNYGGGVFIGNYTGSEADSFRLFRHEDTTYLDYGSGGSYNRISGPYLTSTGDAYEVEFGNRYVKDIPTNTTKISGTSVSFAQKNFTIQLTSQNDYGTFYYVKIFDGDTLVRDLIPCERASDGMVGMWDNVTNSFIEPSASFSKGDYVLIEGTSDDYDVTKTNYDVITGGFIYKALKSNGKFKVLREEVEYDPYWHQPVLTANGTMGVDDFAVAASGEFSGDPVDHKAFRAFDNDPDTQWQQNGVSTGFSQWLTFYIKEGVKLQSLEITNTSQQYTTSNGGLYVMGSNDGTNWVANSPNLPVEGQITPSATWTHEVNWDTPYTYFRIFMGARYTAALMIADIKIHALKA